MAEPLVLPKFPAAEARPEREDLEEAIATFRAELSAIEDRSKKAALTHHIARLLDHSGDTPGAARDELSATNLATGFVEPLEALIAISSRSFSKGNLSRLLERLERVAHSSKEKERALLQHALLLSKQARSEGPSEEAASSSGELARALRLVEQCLEELPGSAIAWLTLDSIASLIGDANLQARAVTGRAAHASSDELTSHLLERLARLQLEAGEGTEALATREQALTAWFRWDSAREFELLAFRLGDLKRAASAAVDAAERIERAREEQERRTSVPSALQAPGQAEAARLRAALAWLEAGEEDRARQQLEIVGYSNEASLLELAFLFRFLEQRGDPSAALAAVEQALEFVANQNQEQWAPVCLMAAVLARRAKQPERSKQLLAQLKRTLPLATGGLALQLWEIVQEGKLEKIIEFLSLLTDSETDRAPEGGASFSEDKGELHVTRSLLSLVQGHTKEALNALREAEQNGLSSGHGGAMRQGIARAQGDRKLELEGLRGRLAVAHGEEVTALLLFGIRVSLLAEHSEWIDQAVEQMEAQGLLADLLRFALRPTRSQLPSEAPQDPKLDRALRLAPCLLPDRSLEERRAQLQLLSARGHSDIMACAAALRTEKDGQRQTKLELLLRLADQCREVAGEVDHPHSAKDEQRGGSSRRKLSTAARLRAACLLLAESLETREMEGALSDRHGYAARALELLEPLRHENELKPLLQWFLRAAGPSNSELISEWTPEARQREPLLQLESALSALFAEKNGTTGTAALELLESPLSPGAKLLRLLLSATVSLAAAEEATSDEASLTDHTRGALCFIAGCSSREAEQRLAGARRWTELAPAADSLLAHCVSARMVGWADEELRTRRALAEELGFVELVAHSHFTAEAEQPLDQLASWATELSKKTYDASPAIAWELIEVLGRRISSNEEKAGLWQARSAALLRLAECLELPHANSLGKETASDETVDAKATRDEDAGEGTTGDDDCATARLLAGFQSLACGQTEKALTIFESLLEVIPQDPTLYHGLRAAAARLSRADLEALASVELARRSDDNKKAAALWERAGVLYDDELGDPERAEAAFSSAMRRLPGSPLSFARLYRSAHRAGDRSRLIELIDARLHTANEPQQRIELLWQKARYGRALGQRATSLQALEELLQLDKTHLPALALSAELYLVDRHLEPAADSLRAVALHPESPQEQREQAGLYAADLLENLDRPRDAVALLNQLGRLGVPQAVTLSRRARASALAGDWDVALSAFRALAEEEDDIGQRLEAAKMMLAIVRDHIGDSDALKDAARLVLRDAPTDADAVDVIIAENVNPEERSRLLEPALLECNQALRQSPLDSFQIRRFHLLTENTGHPELERIALGMTALTASLEEPEHARLKELHEACKKNPTAPLSSADLEAIAAPGQLGIFAQLATKATPFIARAALPSLAALGVTENMRIPPHRSGPHHEETRAWTEALGITQYDLFIGGTHPETIAALFSSPNENSGRASEETDPRALHQNGPRSTDLRPAILFGAGIPFPLPPPSRARLAYLLFSGVLDVSPLLSMPFSEAQAWLSAVAYLTTLEIANEEPDPIEERTRVLAGLIDRQQSEELARLTSDIERAGNHPSDLARAALTGAAKIAVLAHGEPSILRQLPELLPQDETLRERLLADIIRFCISDSFLHLRRKLGLDLT